MVPLQMVPLKFPPTMCIIFGTAKWPPYNTPLYGGGVPCFKILGYTCTSFQFLMTSKTPEILSGIADRGNRTATVLTT